MNKPLRGLNKYRAQQQLGLTLVELLIALSVSTVVVMGAANLVIQTMQARSSAEELRRKRAEWNLARRFIEAEVSSATRVITDVAALRFLRNAALKAMNSPMRLFSRWSGPCGCGMMHPSGKTFRCCLQQSMEFKPLMTAAWSVARPL